MNGIGAWSSWSRSGAGHCSAAVLLAGVNVGRAPTSSLVNESGAWRSWPGVGSTGSLDKLRRSGPSRSRRESSKTLLSSL